MYKTNCKACHDNVGHSRHDTKRKIKYNNKIIPDEHVKQFWINIPITNKEGKNVVHRQRT